MSHDAYLVPASSAEVPKIIGCTNKLAEEGWISPYTGKKLAFNWWREDAPYKHSHLLVSYFYAKNKADFRAGQDLKGLTIISDSGGFQIATQHLKGLKTDLQPEKVLHWQEVNSDIAIALDFPISMEEYMITPEEFKKRLEFLYNNNQVYQKNRNNADTKIYNVLHGDNLEQWEEWYNTVKEFKFEGWSIGVKPSYMPLKISLAIMFLYEKGIRKNLHILGTTGMNVIPIFAYLSNFIENITYDSSTFGQGAMSRNYITPMSLRWDISFGDKTNAKNFKELPCKCPVCQHMTIKEVMDPGSLGGALCSHHNLYWTVQYSYLMNTLKSEKRLFLKFIDNFCTPETKHAIDFIDLAMKQGFKVAYDRYIIHDELFRWKQENPGKLTLF